MNRADEQERGEGRAVVSAPSRQVSPRPAGASPFHVYKPGQGAHVRWGTAIGIGIIIVWLGAFLREQLTRVQNLWVENLVPAAVVVFLGYWLFRMLGQSRSVVDFMIATEGEMKKVSWSSRREVLGATKVVIASVVALGVILFVVDICFIFFFESIGVLRIGMLTQLFSSGAE